MYSVPVTRLDTVQKEIANCTETTGQPCTLFHGWEELLNDNSRIILGHAVDIEGNDIIKTDNLSYPEVLATKADYVFIVDFFSKNKWEKDYQLLLDDASYWIETGELADPKDGKTDDKHKVEKRKDEETGKDKYYQMEKKTDDKKLKGFTEAEIEDLLKGDDK